MRNILLFATLLVLAWAQAAPAHAAALSDTPTPAAPAGSAPAPPCTPPLRLPPAPYQPDSASITLIEQQLAAALRYPPAALAAAEEGQPVVSFDLDRSGRILAVRLAQDSGSAAIDAETLDAFKRIGAFHIKVPATQAPGQERLSLSYGIAFCLFPRSQRDPGLPADAPAGGLRPTRGSLPAAWRGALIAAIGGAWQRPQPMPGRYRLLLGLVFDPAGKLLDASLDQGSGNPALDASLLDAARRASLPPPDNAVYPRALRLCLAAPDSDCARRDSLRDNGDALGVFAYVPDGTPIVKRTGRFATYFQQIQHIVQSAVRYPPDSLKRGEEGHILVRVRIQRDGTISETKLLRNAPAEALNTEARAVFERIGRFPPAPEGLTPEAASFEFQMPIDFAVN